MIEVLSVQYRKGSLHDRSLRYLRRTHRKPCATGSHWLAPEVIERMAHDNPNWRRADGACPACVQQSLLQILLERGDHQRSARHIDNVWPLDAEAAFGALPTPLRMHADPRFTGKGVKIALIHSGFYPHPDLVQPTNRIRAWVDASWRQYSGASVYD